MPNAVRWLDETELLRLIEEMPQRPMLAGDADMRLSLAGAQDKLPVVVADGRIGLPRFGTPSSHILKPVITGALGVPPETKYQNEGGPDLLQSFALLRRATRRSAPQVLQLLDAVIFNALIGNHDAHGKNFSLLYTPRGAVLAPLYDLLATAVYPRLTDKMAMKIGSKYRFTEVQAPHWERFAVDAGLSPAQVKKRVLHTAQRLPTLAQTQWAAWQAQGYSHPALGHIVELVAQRCGLTVHRLAASD